MAKITFDNCVGHTVVIISNYDGSEHRKSVISGLEHWHGKYAIDDKILFYGPMKDPFTGEPYVGQVFAGDYNKLHGKSECCYNGVTWKIID